MLALFHKRTRILRVLLSLLVLFSATVSLAELPENEKLTYAREIFNRGNFNLVILQVTALLSESELCWRDEVDALLLRGKAYFFTNKQELAREDFYSALRKAPGARLDPRSDPPSLYAFFNTCVTALTGQVEIRSEPPGALVFINGLAYGNTPLVLDTLAIGDHSLTLFAPKHRRITSTFTVNAESPIVQSYQLPPVYNPYPYILTFSIGLFIGAGVTYFAEHPPGH